MQDEPEGVTEKTLVGSTFNLATSPGTEQFPVAIVFSGVYTDGTPLYQRYVVGRWTAVRMGLMVACAALRHPFKNPAERPDEQIRGER